MAGAIRMRETEIWREVEAKRAAMMALLRREMREGQSAMSCSMTASPGALVWCGIGGYC
jgi:hypothetical protein